MKRQVAVVVGEVEARHDGRPAGCLSGMATVLSISSPFLSGIVASLVVVAVVVELSYRSESSESVEGGVSHARDRYRS